MVNNLDIDFWQPYTIFNLYSVLLKSEKYNMNPLLNPAYSLDDEIISILPEVVDLYKDLHATPELSLQE